MLLRQPEATPKTIALDPVTLLRHASGPVKLTVFILLVASTAVWVIAILKLFQLARLQSAEQAFEREALRTGSAAELADLAGSHRASPGGRIVSWLVMRKDRIASIDRLRAIADRAIVTERQRASAFMAILGTIAAASPFVGLFGTVYGIIDAFVRIGAEKSASLPVVAPAIGEALMATAIGLAAAIPAVIFYNLIDKRIGDLEAELEASAAEWVQVIADVPVAAPPMQRPISRPPPPRSMGG